MGGKKYNNLGMGLQCKLEPRTDGLLAVVDISAVCHAAAIPLLVTLPRFSFGTHRLPPSVYMNCLELTPLLTPKGEVTLWVTWLAILYVTG